MTGGIEFHNQDRGIRLSVLLVSALLASLSILSKESAHLPCLQDRYSKPVPYLMMKSLLDHPSEGLARRSRVTAKDRYGPALPDIVSTLHYTTRWR